MSGLDPLRPRAATLLAALLIVTSTGAPEPGLAAPPSIGIVVAKGSFRVDNATVAGNATLFEGAVVETREVFSAMALSSGARVRLDSSSRARLFGDHLVLERGAGALDQAEGFRFEARGLSIQPETGNATSRVILAGSAHVQVAVLTGSFRILNSRGQLIASMPPGMQLDFEPQAASAAVTKVTGYVQLKAGHFLIVDETTNVTIEVAGPGLAKEVGNRVEVTGAMDPAVAPSTDASQFIRVTSLKRLSKGQAGGRSGSSSGTAPAGTGGTSAAGISTGAIAVIGGVAAAAVVGGLAAAGDLSTQGGSPISR